MKNKYIIMLLIIISTFSCSFSTFCKEVDTTEATMAKKFPDDLKITKTTLVNDKDVKELFKGIYKIMSAKRQFGKSTENSDVAIDYAVEILQKKPESLEAYYSLICFSNISIDDAIIQKYVRWLDHNYGDLNNPNIDTVHKLVYIRVLEKYITVYKNRFLGALRHYVLLKIKRECKNKNYSALAMLELNYYSCLNEFINNFPDHVAIPLAKLKIAEKYCLNKKYETCINETIKLYEQYKDVELPMGYKYEIECYILLVKVYWKIRDYNNVKRYLLLIKEKAPQRYLSDNLEDDLNTANNILSK